MAVAASAVERIGGGVSTAIKILCLVLCIVRVCHSQSSCDKVLELERQLLQLQKLIGDSKISTSLKISDNRKELYQQVDEINHALELIESGRGYQHVDPDQLKALRGTARSGLGNLLILESTGTQTHATLEDGLRVCESDVAELRRDLCGYSHAEL